MFENQKITAAKAALKLVLSGMILGLGSGSTTTYFIRFLGQKVKHGLQIQAVASSLASETLAIACGISMISFPKLTQIDLMVDGTDRFDSRLNLIKGGGGALFREKILASYSKRTVIIADQSKYSDPLFGFPLAVEILSFGYPFIIQKIMSLGFHGTLREGYVTDNGNYIYDIQLKEPIKDPEKLNQQLRSIPGVIETGLFIGLADQVLMATPQNGIEIFNAKK